MKTHMKKLTAALMAAAMTLSLSVSAFATGLPGEQTDSKSKVTTQGSLPADLVTVVMPTAPASTASDGLFSIIFDSQGLIAKTSAERYEAADGNSGQVQVDADTNFYFKNYTNTAVDETEKLLLDEGNNGPLKAGDEVVVYKKATLVDIYAKVDTTKVDAQSKPVVGYFVKWMKKGATAAEDVAVDTEFASSGAYAKIADLKGLDPFSGFGKDAIDKLNKDDPSLHLRMDANAVSGSASGFEALNGTYKFTFVSAYDDSAKHFVHFDTNDAPDKVFSDLGTSTAPTPVTIGSAGSTTNGEAVFTTDNALMTLVGGNTYGRQQTNKAILSFKKTSAPLKVINKTNADVGVTMSATLTNLPGGDGKKVNNAQTFVYAKSTKFTAAQGTTPAVTQFYDNADPDDASAKEIVGGNDGVPVIYMALNGTNGTSSEDLNDVMAYDTVKKSASAKISAVIPGKDEFYKITWTGTSAEDPNGKYEYALNDTSYPKREADFNYREFKLSGAIDADDDVWDTLSSNPAISVTWKVETVDNLKAPTVAAPTTAFNANAAWKFTVSANPDTLVLAKVKATVGNNGEEEIDLSKITNGLNAKTGLGDITFTAKTFTAKPSNVTFVFAHPSKAFNTKDVSIDIT